MTLDLPSSPHLRARMNQGTIRSTEPRNSTRGRRRRTTSRARAKPTTVFARFVLCPKRTGTCTRVRKRSPSGEAQKLLRTVTTRTSPRSGDRGGNVGLPGEQGAQVRLAARVRAVPREPEGELGDAGVVENLIHLGDQADVQVQPGVPEQPTREHDGRAVVARLQPGSRSAVGV